jgi:multicomponent Na+:H+ antiporter subunit C
MPSLTLAVLVGALFATGTYLILRRGQIKLILGLGLLSHGVNLLIFSTGRLNQIVPPILVASDQAAELSPQAFADPLPQALILTAIVINFGITAFLIVLINRRHTIVGTDVTPGELGRLLQHIDPFAHTHELEEHPPADIEDNSWLLYELDEVYDQRHVETDRIPEDEIGE